MQRGANNAYFASVNSCGDTMETYRLHIVRLTKIANDFVHKFYTIVQLWCFKWVIWAFSPLCCLLTVTSSREDK